MLPVKLAASRLGISPSKVYELVSQRAITFYRVGGKILFEESDLDAYLQSCRVEVVEPQSTTPLRLRLKHVSLAGARRRDSGTGVGSASPT